jgi:predicted nucleic acid-binding protein
VNGYLLDNNVISVAGRRSDKRNPDVMRLLYASGTSPVFLPVIAIAEIEFGMAKVPRPTPDPLRDELRKFFSHYPRLAFGENTIEPYSQVRARVWKKWATPKPGGRGHIERLPEDLILDRITGKTLGIDERDLMIASISIEYSLILVTNDSN